MTAHRRGAIWNYGFSRSGHLPYLQGLQPMVHIACKAMILLSLSINFTQNLSIPKIVYNFVTTVIITTVTKL